MDYKNVGIYSKVLDTAASSEPIAVSEAKNFLRVDTNEDDAFIGTIISSAREYVEEFTGYQLLSATWIQYLDRFPYKANQAIELLMNPVSAITHIKYYDSDNTLQTWSSSNYDTDLKGKPARITKSYNTTYPTTYERTNAVEIKFVAGYASTSSTGFPKQLLNAMYLIIGHLYENRQDVIVGKIAYEIPKGADSILRKYRLFNF
tara:strand:+ start:503 stop:1114 length:612 start_codon:yes stop_codon:yes gene_type:complete